VADHSEKAPGVVPLCSVLSVFSVVLARKITTEYTENTEKTRIRKAEINDCMAMHILHRREIQPESLPNFEMKSAEARRSFTQFSKSSGD